MSRAAIICLMFFVSLAASAVTDAKEFVVVIDPGHGGKDYGAIGKKTNEKSINLAVALKLGEKIAKAYDDVKVVYTRDKDVFIPLNDRAAIANRAKGDLFISIHVNSVDKRNKNRLKIAGAEVYTVGLHKSEDNLAVAQRENSVITLESDYSETYSGFDPNSLESYIAFELSQSKHMERSIEFAAMAQKELTTTAGRADKGVRQAGFWVLWATSMPSVLVELDFICNPQSEDYLASAKGQESLATALFNAFKQYRSSVNGSPSAPSTVKPTETPAITEATEPAVQTQVLIAETTAGSAIDAADAAEDRLNKADTSAKSAVATDAGGYEYRVQIAASDKPLKADSPELKGVKADSYKDKGLYKYTIGSFPSQEAAYKTLRQMRKKFPEAFIIKLKDGHRVY